MIRAKEALGVGVAHHHRPIFTDPRIDLLEVANDSVVGEEPPDSKGF